MSISKLLLTVGAAALVSSAASAGNNGSPNKMLKAPPAQVLKLKKEAYVTGNGLSSPLTTFGYTNIDSGTTLTCTKPCVISADATVQYEPGATGGGWAIATLLDGGTIQSQYQNQADDTFFHVGNITSSISAGIGTHTVQTQVYVEQNNSTYQFYNMHYAVHQ
jgi:hypothetical protein